MPGRIHIEYWQFPFSDKDKQESKRGGNDVNRGLMETLSELVERYNQHLEETQGTDQLDIHKDLQNIIEKLKKFLP